MEENFLGLKLNPVFGPIQRFFEFFMLGMDFVGQPEFQIEMAKINPAFSDLIKRFNKEVKLRKEGNKLKLNTKMYWVYFGRLMAISIFDFLQSSKYNKKLSKEEIYRFAKHIRNGAAHNNQFKIDNKEKLLKKPAKWRNKEITFSLNGKAVITDFINPVELVFLMSDLSELMK